MSKKPVKISVGMPVYNGEKYLESAILATLNQTFGDFELIISDNASTDKTETICRDYASSDSRIRYIRNPTNIGAAGNYNQLFEMANGEYFRWFNADDLCSEYLHERCLGVLEANPDVVLAYGKTDLIDGESQFLQHYEDNLDLQQDSVISRFITFFDVVGLTNAIYGLMRHSALKYTSLMGNGSFYAADTNLMGELTLHGKFVEVSETLFFRRMHEDASSWDRKNSDTQQTFWIGSNKKFYFPTFKKHYAYFKAIHKSPNSYMEKMQLDLHVLRRMLWFRELMWRESVQYFQSR